MRGFFSATAWSGQKQSLPLVPQCGACKIYENCHTHNMPVSGQGRRKVLLVAEAPGQHEDCRGVQLVGNSGSELIRILDKFGVNMRKDCWLHNAIACRPTDREGNNREPTPKELYYCRPNLVKALKEFNPDVVIPMGKSAMKQVMALAWKDGEVKETGKWVGWRIPSVKLGCWICPTYHPSFLLHAKEPAAELHVTRHLREAFALAGTRPWIEPPDFGRRVEVVPDPREAADRVRSLTARGVPLAFDYETTTLKPDGPHAEILCCSVSDGEVSVAYPWVGEAVEATREMVKSPVPKVASNLRMEDRWTRKKLKTAVRNWEDGWDTVLGAHWRDCRHGICSLKFQSFVLLGAEDYSSHLEPYMKGEKGCGNTPNRLKEVDPMVLMTYCALDSLFEVLVYRIQKGESTWRSCATTTSGNSASVTAGKPGRR